jgi:hypothetical protein
MTLTTKMSIQYTVFSARISYQHIKGEREHRPKNKNELHATNHGTGRNDGKNRQHQTFGWL